MFFFIPWGKKTIPHSQQMILQLGHHKCQTMQENDQMETSYGLSCSWLHSGYRHESWVEVLDHVDSGCAFSEWNSHLLGWLAGKEPQLQCLMLLLSSFTSGLASKVPHESQASLRTVMGILAFSAHSWAGVWWGFFALLFPEVIWNALPRYVSVLSRLSGIWSLRCPCYWSSASPWALSQSSSLQMTSTQHHFWMQLSIKLLCQCWLAQQLQQQLYLEKPGSSQMQTG